MRAVIDVALILIPAYCTWTGHKKGLINCAASILAIILSLYAGSFISGAFSGELIPAFEPFTNGIIESKESDALAQMGYTGLSVEDTAAIGPTVELEYCQTIFEQVGMHPKRAAEMALRAITLSNEEALPISDAVSLEFCRDILYIICTVIAGFLILILITVIANIFNFSFHFPNAPRLEAVGGTIAGFFKGLVWCTLLCWLLSFLGIVLGNVLEESFLTRFFLLFDFITAGIL